MDRLSCKGTAADVADIHYRWMLWLMLFGLIHTYRIWWGNILFFYATLGVILYPLRKLSARVAYRLHVCLGSGSNMSCP